MIRTIGKKLSKISMLPPLELLRIRQIDMIIIQNNAQQKVICDKEYWPQSGVRLSVSYH